MLRKFLKLVTCTLAVLACGLSTSAQALPYNQISQVFFFGDSLTDSGFNDAYPLSPGKAPTFTTFAGYTYAQYLARDIKGFVLPVYPGPSPADTITNNSILFGAGIPYVTGLKTGVDYAAGGSTTNSTGYNFTYAPSLTQQINQYLATSGGVADPNAVYFVFSGANDFLTVLSGPTFPTQIQLLMTASTAALNIGNDVALLAAHGAKRIVVMSMPNLGITPLIGLTLPQYAGLIKNLMFTFNGMLNTQLGNVITQYGTKILYEDVYDLLDNVVIATQQGQPFGIAGQSFSFVNFTNPACAPASSALACPSTAPLNWIFADVVHPTDNAHRILSLLVETDIQNWA